jgi:hypothetical protein
LTRLGISRAACERRVRFRNARGKFHGGAFAVNRFVFHAAPDGWKGLPARALVVAAYVLPPLLFLELAAYEVVARNRNCSLLNPSR